MTKLEALEYEDLLEMYKEQLWEKYGPVDILHITFDPATILQTMRPDIFQEGFKEFVARMVDEGNIVEEGSKFYHTH